MEHLGRVAAEAEDEADAEACTGALVPLAARLNPRAAPAIMRSAPQLIRGVSNVTRMLCTKPSTRPLVHAMPTIIRRTAANMANLAAAGRRPTAQHAVRALARQTARTQGRRYARAHLWGRQFGDEAAAGVMYAPTAFNSGAQRVLEDAIKGMRRRLRPGHRLMLWTRATRHAGYPFLSWSTLRRAEYKFTIVTPSGAEVDSVSLRFDVGPPTDPKWDVQGFAL
ncbi:MAG TPA: polymorphic toxin type 4 domain-containing protein [Pseudonocardiaceae bacterium]|nr:polymorphic toxin type 4 domain-containing protein [Pseudonocardiaceae bacterium]